MEEFSDIPQPDLPENEATDIPIFNVPEITSPPQPEKSTLPPITSKEKKADNQDDSTQALFDYMAEDTRAPVASTSRTFEVSEPPKIVLDKPEPETIELPESNKPISKNTNTPPKEILADSSKPSEVSSTILLCRAQREERLRKRAVELGEDPDVFVTITEKDRLDRLTFRNRMKADARVCAWAIETEDDPKEYMEMT
ncbi:hypothetical protein RhiirC2_803658, partial [Rhizophagus irregularis]